MMQLTPFKCLHVLYVLFLSVPRALAFFLVVNIMRALAPTFIFRMLKKKLETTGAWRFAEKVKSVEDIEYMFSFALVKVERLSKPYTEIIARSYRRHISLG